MSNHAHRRKPSNLIALDPPPGFWKRARLFLVWFFAPGRFRRRGNAGHTCVTGTAARGDPTADHATDGLRPFTGRIVRRTVLAVKFDAESARVRAASGRVARLSSIDVQGRPHVVPVAFVVDEDWSKVWWVRLRGDARIARGDEEWDRALRLLAEKYPQYGGDPSRGPVLVVDVTDWSGWVNSGA